MTSAPSEGEEWLDDSGAAREPGLVMVWWSNLNGTIHVVRRKCTYRTAQKCREKELVRAATCLTSSKIGPPPFRNSQQLHMVNSVIESARQYVVYLHHAWLLRKINEEKRSRYMTRI